MTQRQSNLLQNKLNQIEGFLPYFDTINNSISKVNVAWHLDHSLKVINAVLLSLQQSDPNLYEDNFRPMGKLFLRLNYFPRGKAKAPTHVLPPQLIDINDIKTQLTTARKHLIDLPNLNKNAFFKHPMFGNINKARVVRFLNVHTNHHLKIIKHILK